jgi:hypothetical protein
MSIEEARAREERAALAYTDACVVVLEAERMLQQRIEERRVAAEAHVFAMVARVKAEHV